jgi:hypothetical protein
MNILKQIFSEDSKVSLMRIMSGSIVSVSLGIIIFQAVGCDSVDWMGCCSLCALGLGGKAGQKYLEKPTDEPEAN